MSKLTVTVLAENTVRGAKLLAEHGLSYLIEAGDKKILFDTGQGMVLSSNATNLGIKLNDIDAIVLSHGHYDHTGGLDTVLQTGQRTKVFAHPDAFLSRYARNDDGTARSIGIPLLNEGMVRERAEELIWTRKPTQLYDGLYVTGEIPRMTDFEDTGGPFFTDEKCQKPDPLLDDQALFFESDHGTVVLLGCAHAGIINTLNCIRQSTEGKPIHTVVGGMHLVTASTNRVHRTIEAISRLDIKRLGPMHCTGIEATVKIWSSFPGRCFLCPVGTKLEFDKM